MQLLTYGLRLSNILANAKFSFGKGTSEVPLLVSVFAFFLYEKCVVVGGQTESSSSTYAGQ